MLTVEDEAIAMITPCKPQPGSLQGQVRAALHLPFLLSLCPSSVSTHPSGFITGPHPSPISLSKGAQRLGSPRVGDPTCALPSLPPPTKIFMNTAIRSDQRG